MAKYDENELKKKIQQARDAGVPELEIQKRVKAQFGYDMAPAKKEVTTVKPQVPATPQIDPGEQSKLDLENNWLVGPAVKYGGTVLEAVRKLTLLADKDYRDAVFGKELTDEQMKRVEKLDKPKFISEHQQQRTREKPVETAAKNIAGAASYVIPAGKTVGTALKLGAATGALRSFSEEDATLGSVAAGTAGGSIAGGLIYGGGKIFSKAKDIMKGSANKISEKASQDLLKATPTAYKNAAQTGLDLRKIVKKYGIAGNYDELVGTIEEGNGGFVQEGISSAEKVIQDVMKKSGKQKVDITPVINQLKDKIDDLSRIPGNEEKIKVLNEFIGSMTKVGKNLTADKALLMKRAADEMFGKAVIDDTKGAVTGQAQKIVANTLRAQLKTQFPKLAQALDQQHELIVMQNVLKDAQFKGASQGLALGRFDITRPGTLVDPILRSPEVSSRIAKIGGEVVPEIPEELGKGALLKPPKLSGTTLAEQAASLIGAKSVTGGKKKEDVISESRASAVYDLMRQGITDPQEITDALNEAAVASGYESGDFTKDEITAYMSSTDVPQKIKEEMKESEIEEMSHQAGVDERRMKLAYMMWTYPKQASKIKEVYEVMYGKLDAKPTKKTEQQLARDDAIAIANSALADIIDPRKKIVTGALTKLEEAKAGSILGYFMKGSPDTLTFNRKVMMLKAAIAKARAGTSFTPNEEKLLNSYTPEIGDSKQMIMEKLNNLVGFYQNKAEAEEGVEVVPGMPAGLTPDQEVQMQLYLQDQVPESPSDFQTGY